MGRQESVAIDVLGPFRVRVGDRPVDIPPGRQRILLATLAMSGGRATSVDRLADALFGEDLPGNVRRTVQTYVTRMRRALGSAAIFTEPAGYVLRTAPENVDAIRFRRLVERAGREPEVERELLSEALRLWRGEPFEDLESVYLRDTEGRRLQEQRLTAIERRIDLDLAAGQYGALVPELRALTGQHPLREPLWVRLLVALGAAGRHAEALEQYDAVRSRIAEELGVDPGTELRRIHADLLQGTTPSVVAPDVTRSEPLVPRQLPAGIGEFVGRSDALADLDRALDDGAGVVAVHGTGGVGKTTLAVQWAHTVADRFPGGQLYLNLRGYGRGNPMPPAAAMDALLRGLGVPGEEIPPETDARESLLRSVLASRRILMVLDNAQSAEQVRPLLPGSPESMVVITSRSQLRGLVAREGARRVGLNHLRAEESIALLRSVLEKAQVRHDPASLTELAQHCGNLPLALAIAAEQATRNPDTGLRELIEDLRAERRRLDALQAGDESTDLRAVFAWSYRSLDDETARMFRLLGLYPGPDFGIPAVAALAGRTTPQTRRLIDHLVDGHLVQRRRGGRFELHDLIREYAAELAEQLDEDERQTALSRLFEWLVHSALSARRVMIKQAMLFDLGEPPAEVTPAQFEGRGQAMAWYDVEHPSLVTAVHFAADLGVHHAVLRLVFSTWAHLMRRRLFDDMLDILPLAETAAGHVGDAAERGQVAYLRGWTFGEIGEPEQSCDAFRRAIELFELAGHDHGRQRALGNLGVALIGRGQLQEAAAYLERAVEVGTQLDYEPVLVNPLYNLATVYLAMENAERAAALCERAIEICRRVNHDRSQLAMVTVTLGEVRDAQGRTIEAIELYRESIEMLRAEGDRWWEGAAMTNLGRSLREAGRTEEAREVWRQALDLFDELGAPDGQHFSRTELVELLASVEPSVNR